MRMSILRGRVKTNSFFRGRRHRHGIVVARKALRLRNHFDRAGTLMFLMTRRTGTILDHVRFMKRVLLVAALAFAIDRVESDAVLETIAQNFAEFSIHGVLIVTGAAVVGDGRVTGGNFSGVKKSFAAALLKNENRRETDQDRQ